MAARCLVGGRYVLLSKAPGGDDEFSGFALWGTRSLLLGYDVEPPSEIGVVNHPGVCQLHRCVKVAPTQFGEHPDGELLADLLRQGAPVEPGVGELELGPDAVGAQRD